RGRQAEILFRNFYNRSRAQKLRRLFFVHLTNQGRCRSSRSRSQCSQLRLSFRRFGKHLGLSMAIGVPILRLKSLSACICYKERSDRIAYHLQPIQEGGLWLILTQNRENILLTKRNISHFLRILSF